MFRVEHAVVVGVDFLAWGGGDCVVFSVLQFVLKVLYTKGNERHDAFSEFCVEEIVAQGEVEEFSLPNHLLSGWLASGVEAQVVVVEIDDFGGVVGVVDTFVYNHPCPVFHHSLRNRLDATEPAAVNVDEAAEFAFVA